MGMKLAGVDGAQVKQRQPLRDGLIGFRMLGQGDEGAVKGGGCRPSAGDLGMVSPR